MEFCPKCGETTFLLNEYTGWCSNCSRIDPYVQLELFLEKNADHIEHYLCNGYSFSASIRMVARDNRPICLCCGIVIPRAPRNAIFCSRGSTCRRARNRYNYLTKQKGIPKAFALALVLGEIKDQYDKRVA